MSEANVYTNALLKITSRIEPDKIVLHWTGKSTEREPSKFLIPIFDEVDAICEKENKLLELNFTELEFMNSSTITPIIKLLNKAKTTGRRVSIIYKKSLKWQELSFTALFIFQTNDNQLQINGI